jgi:lysophospholipase L1-like esterase
VTKFVAFGDSITYGEDGRVEPATMSLPPALRPFFQFPPAQTYPGQLLARLQARYSGQVQDLRVTNEGKRGEPASDSSTLIRFASAVNSSEAVLLMEGSNDVNTLDPATIQAAVSGLQSMVRLGRQRGLRVYLATIPPEVPGLLNAANPAGIGPFNVNVRALANAEGVPLVDVESGFGASYQQYIGFDGLHPNEAGYARIAELFFDTLRATLEVTTPSATTLAVPQSGSPRSPVRRRP